MRIGRLIFFAVLSVPPFAVHAQNVPPGLPSGHLSRYPGNPLVRNGPEKYEIRRESGPSSRAMGRLGRRIPRRGRRLASVARRAG